MNQVWHLNGRTYNHAQLMELKRKEASKSEAEESVVEEEAPVETEEEVKPAEETPPTEEKTEPEVEEPLAEETATEPEDQQSEAYENMNFFSLKKLAKEKGMEVTKDTKKVDIIKYLTK